MRIARYWAKAEFQLPAHPGEQPHQGTCWRGSATSLAEARRLAADAAQRVMAHAAARMNARPAQTPPQSESYEYADRMLREELLEELQSPVGEVEAAITRNGYGAEILNTARVCFIDVDLRPPGWWETRLHRWRNRHRQGEAAEHPGLDRALTRLDQWLAMHPDWSVRVYRTLAGLRYLVTHGLFDPTDRDTQAAMHFLGADPYYMKLCKAQQSFRARLTPKPWRCGLIVPPVLFLLESEEEKRWAREWLAEYEEAVRAYAVCRLLGERGAGRVVPGVARMMKVHDRKVGLESGLPLA